MKPQEQKPDKWAQQALERLTKDGLRPIPENFSVYYHYFAGDKPNLNIAMDALLNQYGSLTQALCTTLYQNHLSFETEHKVIQETNAAIEAEIKHVLSVIDAAASGTQKFGQSLDNLSGTLSGTNSLEQIRETVTKVAAETRAMAKQNQRLQSQLTQATEQLTEMRYNLDVAHKESQIDPLTEVGNRKFFDTELTRATSEAVENKAPLSLLMIDIDHFKKFNDTYGHLVGDQVLRLVARTLVENLKGRDVIARYGGEEFVILLPQTEVAVAEKVANQLRDSLGTKQIRRRSTQEALGIVTISIGATQYCPGEDVENFIARADTALYRAKHTGRNRVVSELLTPEAVAQVKASGKEEQMA